MNHRCELKDFSESRIRTFASAFLCASAHARAKSGTNSGLSTGGGCLGRLAGYTFEIGGSEEGEGKGMKIYGVVGIMDGPGCVSRLPLVVVVVRRAEVETLKEEEGKIGGDTLPPE
jgi:hypothetical protein